MIFLTHMKVLRVKSRNYKGKQYYKYRINIPEQNLKEAGFEVGDELNSEAKKGEIKLRKKLVPARYTAKLKLMRRLAN